jgi:hypothetical protein
MILQAWLTEALVPALLSFLLIWKSLGRKRGSVVVMSKWWYVFGVAATMVLTVVFRYALLIWFGGAEIVSPSGSWSIVNSLVLPVFSAFLASQILLRVPTDRSNAVGVSLAKQISSWLPFLKIMSLLLGFVIAIFVSTNFWLDRQGQSQVSINLSASRAEAGHPGFDSKGWTQESTGTANIGPWLDYSPAGTRYYRDANDVIFRVYPPGVKPDAPPANPFGVGISSETIPPVSTDN